LSSYQIPSSAISIPSNFIFFKSHCGGERRREQYGGKEGIKFMIYIYSRIEI
jgi:hypothetical protein